MLLLFWEFNISFATVYCWWNQSGWLVSVLGNNSHSEKNFLFLEFIIHPQSWSAFSHIGLREFLYKRKLKKERGKFTGPLALSESLLIIGLNFIYQKELMLLQFLKWWKWELKVYKVSLISKQKIHHLNSGLFDYPFQS